MTQLQIEEIFETYGLSHLYQKLHFPLWLTGVMEKLEPEILEDFFESYDFEQIDTIFVDDFLFQFRTFLKVYESFQ